MIGERLTYIRLKRGLSQRELAEKISVSTVSMSRYERELMVPSDSKKVEIAKVLNVSLDYLLGAVDDEKALQWANLELSTTLPDNQLDIIKLFISFIELMQDERSKEMINHWKSLTPKQRKRYLQHIKNSAED